MIYINKYKVLPTSTFKEELQEIIHYIKYDLYQPIVARKIYDNIISKINLLEFMPERYKRIIGIYNKNIRRMIINNYAIIYEIKNDTRTNIYFTYIPQHTKLFLQIIKHILFKIF